LGSVLAIDHGTRRTGFAVADALRLHHAPLEVFHGPGDGMELQQYVDELLEERDVDVFLVGLPLGKDGQRGARAREVEAFARLLAERHPGIELVFHDEHLTTREAEDRLRESGLHGEARKARKDSWSAWVLLEDWLEAGEPR